MTIQQIINIAKVSEYLSANSILRSGLFGSGTPSYLPSLIRQVRQSVERKYQEDPTDEYLIGNADYLYSLCNRFNKIAQSVTGGGGSIASQTSTNQGIYPFVITSADFEDDGVSYNNPNIVGDNLELFPNQLNQQFWYAGQGLFVYSSSGIIITYPGFDANTQDWTIRIDQVFGNGIPPAATSNIISETSNNLITETGNNIILE